MKLGLLFVFLLLCNAPVHATIGDFIVVVQCPACDHNIKWMRSQEFGLRRNLGPELEDWEGIRERYFTCEDCLFTETPDRLRALKGSGEAFPVSKEIPQLLLDVPVSGIPDWLSCDLAVLVRQRSGRSHEEVARARLHYAWAKRQAGQSLGTPEWVHEERVNLEKALSEVELSLADPRTQQLAALIYLSGELHRRLGHFDQARTFYARAWARPDLDPRIKAMIPGQLALMEEPREKRSWVAVAAGVALLTLLVRRRRKRR